MRLCALTPFVLAALVLWQPHLAAQELSCEEASYADRIILVCTTIEGTSDDEPPPPEPTADPEPTAASESVPVSPNADAGDDDLVDADQPAGDADEAPADDAGDAADDVKSGAEERQDNAADGEQPDDQQTSRGDRGGRTGLAPVARPTPKPVPSDEEAADNQLDEQAEPANPEITTEDQDTSDTEVPARGDDDDAIAGTTEERAMPILPGVNDDARALSLAAIGVSIALGGAMLFAARKERRSDLS